MLGYVDVADDPNETGDEELARLASCRAACSATTPMLTGPRGARRTPTLGPRCVGASAVRPSIVGRLLDAPSPPGRVELVR